MPTLTGSSKGMRYSIIPALICAPLLLLSYVLQIILWVTLIKLAVSYIQFIRLGVDQYGFTAKFIFEWSIQFYSNRILEIGVTIGLLYLISIRRQINRIEDRLSHVRITTAALAHWFGWTDLKSPKFEEFKSLSVWDQFVYSITLKLIGIDPTFDLDWRPMINGKVITFHDALTKERQA